MDNPTLIFGLLITLLLSGCISQKPAIATAYQPPWASEYPKGFLIDHKQPAPRSEFLRDTPIHADDLSINIWGNVEHPGHYFLPHGSTLVDAVLAAGGMSEGGILGGSFRVNIQRSNGDRLEAYLIEPSSGIESFKKFRLQTGDIISKSM